MFTVVTSPCFYVLFLFNLICFCTFSINDIQLVAKAQISWLKLIS